MKQNSYSFADLLRFSNLRVFVVKIAFQLNLLPVPVSFSRQRRYSYQTPANAAGTKHENITKGTRAMNQVKGTVNRVEMIGWLGMDPEMRFIPSGVAVCSFRVATKRAVGRMDSGERIIETEWLPVEVWDRTAELCGKYLHKGSRVRIVGHLENQSWDDKKTGERRSKLVVRANDVLFLDAKPEAQHDAEVIEEAAEQMVEDLPF